MAGVTTGLLIGGLISAGTKIAGNVVRGRAEKKAADRQADTASTVAEMARGAGERGAAAFAPYAQRGAAAFNLLGDLSGVPQGAPLGGPPPTMGEMGTGLSPKEQAFSDARNAYLNEHGRGLVDQFRATNAGRNAVRSFGGVAPPSERTRTGFGGGPEPTQPQTPTAPPRTAGYYGGARVRMRAPDGSEEDVSPDEVEMFERMGARRAR